MKQPKETLQIVQSHLQKYNSTDGGSCVASGIEMILKLEALVAETFYEIQDQYKYQNTGFAEFEGKNLHGLTFHSKRYSTRDGSIQRLLESELLEQRYALISLPTGGWHIFLVYLLYEGDYHVVSKWSIPELGSEPLRLNLRATLNQFFEVFDSFDVMTYKRG
jgi:hypothetical protein